MSDNRRPFYGPPPPLPDWMRFVVDTVVESMELGWCEQLDGPGSPQWEAECDEFGCHEQEPGQP
jgi:hypothetical protein